MYNALPVSLTWFIITYIWTSLCFLILLTVNIVNIWQQYCAKNTKKQKNVFKFLTSFTIISCLLCSGLDIGHITIHFITSSEFQSSLESIIAGFADIAYFIGSTSFYLFLMIKIWFIFRGTIYEISMCTLFLMGFLLSVIIFFAVWHCNDTAFQPNKSDYNPHEHPATYALSGADFALNSVLFFLFWYKLRQTIVCVEIDSVGGQYDPTNRLSQIVSKHSILFGVAMVTNQCFYIGIMLEEYFRIDKINYTEAILILFSARAFENLVNALVLWLMLAINWKLYFKLCGVCHTKMQNCCKLCMTSTVNSNMGVNLNMMIDKPVDSTLTMTNEIIGS